MKIMYILHTTSTTDGSSKSFMQMLDILMNNDIEPLIILPDKNGLYHVFKEKSIEVHQLTYRPSTYPPYLRNLKDYLIYIPRIIARIWVNYKASKKIKGLIASNKIDIVHTNVGVINIGYNAAIPMNIPHIYHIREYADLDFNLHYFPNKKSFIKQLSSPLCHSVFITRGLQNYFHQENNGNSCVIYNGITKKKETLTYLEKENYFLFVGRVEPSKDLLLLIEAYSDFRNTSDENIHLYIAGGATDKDYLNKVKDLINERKLDDSIHLLGVRKDVNDLMRKAKATIITSKAEAFGRVAAEAMFNGCLVIGRNTGGTKEQMDNGVKLRGKEIALRFSTKEELTENLLKASKDSSYFLPMIKDAFEVVNTLYTSENNADEIRKKYHQILSHSN